MTGLLLSMDACRGILIQAYSLCVFVCLRWRGGLLYTYCVRVCVWRVVNI